MSKTIAHALWGGFPICGFSNCRPHNWPGNHVWHPTTVWPPLENEMKDRNAEICERCDRMVRKSTEDEGNYVTNKLHNMGITCPKCHTPNAFRKVDAPTAFPCKECGYSIPTHLRNRTVSDERFLHTSDFDSLIKINAPIRDRQEDKEVSACWDRLNSVQDLEDLAKWIYDELAQKEVAELMARLWMMITFGEDRFNKFRDLW